MDPASKAQALIKSPQTSPFGPNHPHSPHASFPIIAVAIIGILATAFLLVGYYIFVIKCCLGWHRIDILRCLSFSRRRGTAEDLLLPAYHSPAAAERRGLDQAAIRSIPIFEFKRLKNGQNDKGLVKVQSFECAVCLNEFQEVDKLRFIPNCAHVFHIDCIDVWLQNNANCPLCRTSVSSSSNVHFPLDRVIFPGPSGDFSSQDEDYLVIEVGPEVGSVGPSVSIVEESSNLDGIRTTKISRKTGKRVTLVSSKGDECIDSRRRDESFMVQPIRRSFSMDSGVDNQLYLAVQEIIQRHKEVNCNNNNNNNNSIISSNEGCTRVSRRSFFTFGQGKGAVQPVELD